MKNLAVNFEEIATQPTEGPKEEGTEWLGTVKLSVFPLQQVLNFLWVIAIKLLSGFQGLSHLEQTMATTARPGWSQRLATC